MLKGEFSITGKFFTAVFWTASVNVTFIFYGFDYFLNIIFPKLCEGARFIVDKTPIILYNKNKDHQLIITIVKELS